MNRIEAEKLVATIQSLVDRSDEPMPKGGVIPVKLKEAPRGNGSADRYPDGNMVAGVQPPKDDFEALYQRIKRRFLDEAKVDPILVQLIAAQPEIVLEIEPRTVALDSTSLKGRIAVLAARGHFAEWRTQGEIKRELVKTGPEPAGNRLSEAVTWLVNDGILERDPAPSYRLAAGVKVTQRELVKGV